MKDCGKTQEELPDQGSAPKVIPKEMAKGKGGGLGPSRGNQTEARGGYVELPGSIGMTWLTFARAWFSLKGAATPSQGPSLTFNWPRKPISPHFQTSNDSIIRLVMFREISGVSVLEHVLEPEWVRVSQRDAEPPGQRCWPSGDRDLTISHNGG